jgi:hypothetical protein
MFDWMIKRKLPWWGIILVVALVLWFSFIALTPRID